MSSTVSGVLWKANYGEISENSNFRVGRVGSESWDASFPISQLTDLVTVLQGVGSLPVGTVQKGAWNQARRVSTGLFTDVIIEPRSDTGTPAEILRFGTAELQDMLYVLQLLAADLVNQFPDDWDFSDAPTALAFDKYGRVTSQLAQERLEATVVEMVPVANDPVVAGLINDPASETAIQLSATIGAEVERGASVNALDHGVKADGVTDDSAAWSALVASLSTFGRVSVTWTGNSILDAPIIWASGVSLFGQGWGRSVLSTRDTTGTSYFSAIQYLAQNGASISNPLTDCTFANFEIDGSGLSGGGPNIGGKAIFAQWLVRCQFLNLYLHDTIGTALGVDFLPDCIIQGCLVERGGRGWDGAAGGHAGIGIGMGAWEYENVIIANNTVRDSGHWGIFVEYQDGEPYQGTGARIVGNTVMGTEGHGIGDRGCRGTLIHGNLVYGSGQSGISLSYGAQEDIVTGNHVYGNGQYGIALEANTARNTISENTVVGNALFGISIRSENSNAAGIHPDGYLPRAPGNRIRSNNVRRNGSVGIYATSLGATAGIDDLEITENTVAENGETHASYKQGIRIEANSLYLSVSRNRAYDRRAIPKQSSGISIYAGAYTVAGGEVRGNNLAGQGTPTAIVPTTLIIRDNIGAATESRGAGTIPDGQATVNIPHTLSSSPSRVFVTPKGGELIWVDTIGVSGVIYRRAGTAGALGFSWQAEI